MKDEPKWLAILDEVESSNKTKLDDDGGVEDNMKKPEDSEKERPIGTKEAKKQCLGKGKGKTEDIGLDEDMKKYMDIQAAATKRHEYFLETQQRVSDAKIEAARLRKEAALLESYKALMSMDTSQQYLLGSQQYCALQITRQSAYTTNKQLLPNPTSMQAISIYCCLLPLFHLFHIVQTSVPYTSFLVFLSTLISKHVGSVRRFHRPI